MYRHVALCRSSRAFKSVDLDVVNNRLDDQADFFMAITTPTITPASCDRLHMRSMSRSIKAGRMMALAELPLGSSVSGDICG
jgi:hypothetical protein